MSPSLVGHSEAGVSPFDSPTTCDAQRRGLEVVATGQNTLGIERTVDVRKPSLRRDGLLTVGDSTQFPQLPEG